MIMLPRLQAEEQTERINAARLAQGAADDDGKREQERYMRDLDRRRTGEAADAERPAEPSTMMRMMGAAALGLTIGKPRPKR